MRKNYKFLLTFPKNLQKRGEYLIFSLPQTNHYQTIKNFNLKPQGLKDKILKVKENRVIIITLNDVTKKTKLQFTTYPKNHQINLNSKLTINDYPNQLITQQNNLFQPNRFINGSDKQIKKLAQNIVGKEILISKIINKLYYFTLDYLTYGKPFEGLYSYKQAMKEKITDCGGFSTFLASLLQAAGVPSRLAVGFLIKENLLIKLFSRFNFCFLNFKFLSIHAWLEVLLPNSSWFPLDPSIEWRRNKGLTKRLGGFGFIPADRLVVSFGCDYKIKINDKIYPIDLLQNPLFL